MNLFPFDLITGALLVISSLMMVIGIAVFRYRRGIGPVFLASSGVSILTASLLEVLTTTEVLDIPDSIRYAILIIGLMLGAASIFLWRK